VDPRNPGGVDEILHLGDFWDAAKLKANKEEILRLNTRVSEFFQRTYKYLAAAESVYQDWEATIKKHMSSGYINQKAAELIERIYGNRPVSEIEGKIRHLFGSAITPDGMINHLETIIDPMPMKIVLHGLPGTGRSKLLNKVAEAGIERGLDLEMFHCALNPDRVEHLVVPDLGVAITTSEEPHAYTRSKSDLWINLNSGVREKGLEDDAEILATVQKYYWELLGVAVSYIRKAKEIHDEMEKLYIPNMDFKAIGQLRQRVLNQILETQK
ncbi:MAG: ATPase, partial [Firmicutes bacterium]|nr:ATPase [Bacillota bacterium]